MIDQVLQKLIEFLENASPAVWETLMKQVYANSVGSVIGAVISGIFAILGFILCGVFFKDGGEDTTGAGVFFFFVGLAGVALTIHFGFKAWNMNFNPEYYAIMNVINSLKVVTP